MMRVRAVHNSSYVDYAAALLSADAGSVAPARAAVSQKDESSDHDQVSSARFEAGSRFVSGDSLAYYRQITAASSASGTTNFKRRLFA
jgi:hypothetical protein